MNDIITLDDLPFNFTKEESQQLMEIIPKDISAIGEINGYSDSIFKEKLMEYIIIEKLKYESFDEFYKSDVAQNYFDSSVILSNELIFGGIEKFIIHFSAVFYTKDGDLQNNNGTIGITAINLSKAKNNAFFAVASNLFKNKLVLQKLEILKII